MHSTTKYLNGHSDAIGGAADRARRQASSPSASATCRTRSARCPVRSTRFLTLRGIKTLALRMERHCANALAVAQFLEQHPPGRARVLPRARRATRSTRWRGGRWPSGYGGIVTAVLRGGLDAARRMLERCQLFSLAESLGGVESLIEHPAIMTHASLPAAMRAALGISDGLIRLSVGVEDVEDLIAELRRALG